MHNVLYTVHNIASYEHQYQFKYIKKHKQYSNKMPLIPVLEGEILFIVFLPVNTFPLQRNLQKENLSKCKIKT